MLPDKDTINQRAETSFNDTGAGLSLVAAVPLVALLVGLVLVDHNFGDGVIAMHQSRMASMPLVLGSLWSVSVQLLNWVEGLWEGISWFDAEHEFVAQVIGALEPYGGVSVEDVNGNELDPDNLPHPNTPDGGSDCVISIDQDYYPTERGFKWIRTRIENIVEEILEDF